MSRDVLGTSKNVAAALISIPILGFLAVVVGGVLAGVADVAIPTHIAGTMLAGTDPASPQVWTAIGLVVIIAVAWAWEAR